MPLHENESAAKERNRRGISHYELFEYEVAIKCFDQAIEVDSKFINAWYNKGISLVKLGRLDEAVYCYNVALEINPADYETWSSMGKAYRRLGGSC